MFPSNVILTIGHSTHSIGRFVELLTSHGITALADVRSSPYSRLNPQFNREQLQASLVGAGIAYGFLGQELGARSVNPECYIEGRADYDLISQTPLFRRGIEKVVKTSHKHRVALMCAERDPLTCHRGILICRHLLAHPVEVQHIRESGQIEAHDVALKRLLAELEIEERDLFRTYDEILVEAYTRRGVQIAYREKQTIVGSDPVGAKL